jgi:N-acetyl-gamma-glutamylphosphate reductase
VHKVHPSLRGIVDLVITGADYDEMGRSADAVFVATPHGVAMKFVPKILEGGAKVIDLSADYRFDDPKVFEQHYKTTHESPHLKAIYGLPELYRQKIKEAKFIANPGCYPTAAILSLAPLLKEQIIDIEDDFVPVGEGAGDQLREEVLDDQNKPDDPVCVGKCAALGANRAWAEGNPHGDDHHAEDHQEASDVHKETVPIALISQVNVGPAFQSVLLLPK